MDHRMPYHNAPPPKRGHPDYWSASPDVDKKQKLDQGYGFHQPPWSQFNYDQPTNVDSRRSWNEPKPLFPNQLIGKRTYNYYGSNRPPSRGGQYGNKKTGNIHNKPNILKRPVSSKQVDDKPCGSDKTSNDADTKKRTFTVGEHLALIRRRNQQPASLSSNETGESSGEVSTSKNNSNLRKILVIEVSPEAKTNSENSNTSLHESCEIDSNDISSTSITNNEVISADEPFDGFEAESVNNLITEEPHTLVDSQENEPHGEGDSLGETTETEVKEGSRKNEDCEQHLVLKNGLNLPICNQTADDTVNTVQFVDLPTEATPSESRYLCDEEKSSLSCNEIKLSSQEFNSKAEGSMPGNNNTGEKELCESEEKFSNSINNELYGGNKQAVSDDIMKMTIANIVRTELARHTTAYIDAENKMALWVTRMKNFQHQVAKMIRMKVIFNKPSVKEMSTQMSEEDSEKDSPQENMDTSEVTSNDIPPSSPYHGQQKNTECAATPTIKSKANDLHSAVVPSPPCVSAHVASTSTLGTIVPNANQDVGSKEPPTKSVHECIDLTLDDEASASHPKEILPNPPSVHEQQTPLPPRALLDENDPMIKRIRRICDDLVGINVNITPDEEIKTNLMRAFECAKPLKNLLKTAPLHIRPRLKEEERRLGQACATLKHAFKQKAIVKNATVSNASCYPPQAFLRTPLPNTNNNQQTSPIRQQVLHPAPIQVQKNIRPKLIPATQSANTSDTQTMNSSGVGKKSPQSQGTTRAYDIKLLPQETIDQLQRAGQLFTVNGTKTSTGEIALTLPPDFQHKFPAGTKIVPLNPAAILNNTSVSTHDPQSHVICVSSNTGQLRPNAPSNGLLAPNAPSNGPLAPNVPNNGPLRSLVQNSGTLRPNVQNTGQLRPNVQNTGQLRPNVQNTGQLRPNVQNTGQLRPNVQNTGQLRPNVQNTGQLRPNVQNNGPLRPTIQNNGTLRPNGQNTGPVVQNTLNIRPNAPNSGNLRPNTQNPVAHRPTAPIPNATGIQSGNSLHVRANPNAVVGSVPTQKFISLSSLPSTHTFQTVVSSQQHPNHAIHHLPTPTTSQKSSGPPPIQQQSSLQSPPAPLNTTTSPKQTPVSTQPSNPTPCLVTPSSAPQQIHRSVGNQNALPTTRAIAPKIYKTSNPTDSPKNSKPSVQHPAPLPPTPFPKSILPPEGNLLLPPRPFLKISKNPTGLVLHWNMRVPVNTADILRYQLFAYQETSTTVRATSNWKKIDDVKALPLPMACTLTKFQPGCKYYFAVRAVDEYGRIGSFSDPASAEK